MSAVPVARLFGFEIRVHVSWALILAIIAVTVTTQIAAMAPEVEPAARWAVAAVIAASFLVSALAHELGHAIAARRSGIAGGPIIVYFFGGAASPALDARRPRDEIVAALAGPAVSLAIGALILAVAGLGFLVGSGPMLVVGRVALVIGAINVALGGLNLLPAFPLDGGRVVRGLAWARTGDPAAGLAIAARTGRWLGIGLAIAGFVLILAIDSIDGLMLALSGWFLVSSAQAVKRTGEIDTLLRGIHVSDVMDRDVTGVPPGLTLDTFADQVLGAGHAPTLPVLRGRELLGMVGARQVRRIRRDRWAQTRAEDLMVSGDSLPEVGPDTTLRAALDQLQRSGMDGLPVVEAGNLTGIVTRLAVAEAIRDRLRAAETAGT